MKPSWGLALLLSGAALPAQTVSATEMETWEREQLPLRFAKLSQQLSTQLVRDWRRLAWRGVEWGYCVTQWQTAITRDRDTVFIATRATIRQAPDATRDAIGFDCKDQDNRPLPAIHAHLSGDCTPSRADITNALARQSVPFSLIVCGPGIAVSVDPRLYVSAIGFHTTRAHQK